MEIKRQLAVFLQDELKLELSEEKTLITHARDGTAHFLGYDIHTLHADDKHDHRGQRCINGAIGLRVPARVIHAHCAKYMRRGKPIYLMQRVSDSAYSRFKTLRQNEHGVYKVLGVTVDRGPGQAPLVARFGGIPLRWKKWAAINDTKTQPIWSKRSEVVERLLAQKCELCGAEDNIEVHHMRKLADLEHKGQAGKPEWVRMMAARRRKTLVVCQSCHHDIHYGRYDGPALSK